MECSAQTVSGKINGHDYVDLGLPSGLKWATTNLSNYYYTWGDINHEYTFRCDDYKWCERKSNEPIAMQDANNSDLFRITKYGEKDGKTTLEAADDAAQPNGKHHGACQQRKSCKNCMMAANGSIFSQTRAQE